MENEFSDGLEAKNELKTTDLRIKNEADFLRQFLTFDDAIQSLATYRIFAEDAIKAMGRLRLMANESEKSAITNIDELSNHAIICVNLAEAALSREMSTFENASKRGKAAADVLHDKLGGSREKRQKILDIWATGKYTKRDVCAEEECAGIGLSFSKARRHLIGTPDNPKPKKD